MRTTTGDLPRFGTSVTGRWCRAAAGVATVVLAVSGCTGSGSAGGEQTPTPSQTVTSAAAPAPAGLPQVPDIAARLQPSVVTVLAGGGNGSGVVYAADGLIVTNEHVVRGQTDVQVAFADGQRVPGTVEATDPITDLALVQADRQNLPAATFQTAPPTVGSLAVVIGSPLGFENSVAAGIISGLHREIPGSAAASQALVDLIQTDAPISPGNSGGALINGQGEVVGINVAYIPPQAGAVALGFAIPAATAVDIVEQLRTDGRARHAYAGLVPAAITPEIAAQLGVDSTDGVLVTSVAAGGPAAEAGVEPGDIITAVDDTPTRAPEEFLAALRRHRPGDTVTLTVRQPGQADRQERLTVTDRPTTPRR